MRIRFHAALLLTVGVLGLVDARSVSAQPASVLSPAFAGVTFAAVNGGAPATPRLSPITLTLALPEDAGAQTPRPVAFEYSDAYRLRAKIHRYASFATLPLFALEGWAGSSLYNDPTEAKKTTHLVLAGTIAALFAVNSVTGVWNLIESRKDPNGRTRRRLHGILMLAADAGFVATAMTAPESEHGESGEGGSRSTHRAIAFTSIGLATASYLIMLFER